jgi:Flp pilus assembly protein TadG
LAFRSDKGAVTAEFMLVTPALILAVTLLLGLFPLALSAIKLELTAMQLSRLHSLGESVSAPAGYEMFTYSKGRYECLVLKSTLLILESEYCAMSVG